MEFMTTKSMKAVEKETNINLAEASSDSVRFSTLPVSHFQRCRCMNEKSVASSSLLLSSSSSLSSSSPKRAIACLTRKGHMYLTPFCSLFLSNRSPTHPASICYFRLTDSFLVTCFFPCD